MSTEHPPLDAGWLRERLVQPHGAYARLDVVTETSSTNSDLAAVAAEGDRGAVDRAVLIAEYQSGGRGRRQRGWVSPPGLGLHVSVLLRPEGVPHARLSWVSLLAGIALTGAVRELTTLDAGLKWPNDLLVDVAGEPHKCAGILSEAVTVSGVRERGMAIVLGVGVNVLHDPNELPAGSGLTPTSLAAAGSGVGREELAAVLLRRFAELDDRWRAHRGDPRAAGLLDEYRRDCVTLGQRVRVEFATGEPLFGTAAGVDDDGRLLVRDPAGSEQPVSAGDVAHLRPATS